MSGQSRGRILRQLAIAAVISMAITGTFQLPKTISTITSSRYPRADQLLCFPPNPDIAGVGIRVSVYAQSFYLLFSALLYIPHGYFGLWELKMSRTNLHITAFAILVTSLAQATTSGLSIYHALIVLNLSWILTTSALILSILPAIDDLAGSEVFDSKRVVWYRRLMFWPSRISQIPDIILVSLQMSFMGVLGVYIWRKPNQLQSPEPMALSDSAACLRETIIHIFFVRLRVSSNSVRLASRLWYTFVAIPFVNILVLGTMVVTIANAINSLIPVPYTFGRFYRIMCIVQCCITFLIIANTELSISVNRRLTAPGESRWGLSQTFAIFLLLISNLEYYSMIRSKFRRNYIPSPGLVQFWFQQRLRVCKEPWLDQYMQMRGDISMAISLLERDNVDLPSPTTNQSIVALKCAGSLLDKAHSRIHHSAAVGPSRVSSWDLPTLASESVPMSPWRESEGAVVTLPPPTTSPSRDVIARRIFRGNLEPPAELIADTLDRISVACEVRFHEISDTTSFFIFNRYLRATSDALVAAQAGLTI